MSARKPDTLAAMTAVEIARRLAELHQQQVVADADFSEACTTGNDRTKSEMDDRSDKLGHIAMEYEALAALVSPIDRIGAPVQAVLAYHTAKVMSESSLALKGEESPHSREMLEHVLVLLAKALPVLADAVKVDGAELGVFWDRYMPRVAGRAPA